VRPAGQRYLHDRLTLLTRHMAAQAGGRAAGRERRLARRHDRPMGHQIADPADARHAVVTLHYEGWNAKSIAAYLGTSRQTVHAILHRWVEEGRFGLDDKAPGPKPGIRKAGFRAVAAIKKLQKNELLGEFRVSAALKRMGIRVPPRTCGRIMAHHRKLYGIGQHTKEPTEKKPMPFAATRRHEVWTTDIRYLDTPLLGQQAYCITILGGYTALTHQAGVTVKIPLSPANGSHATIQEGSGTA